MNLFESGGTIGGMIILAGILSGKNEANQMIRKRNVIECASGVRHWHGTRPDICFSQMVIFDFNYVIKEKE